MGIKVWAIGWAGILLLAQPFAVSSAQSVQAEESTVQLELRTCHPTISASGSYVTKDSSYPVDLNRDLGMKRGELTEGRVDWKVSSKREFFFEKFTGTFQGRAERKERISFFNGMISREVVHQAEENLSIAYGKMGYIFYNASQSSPFRQGFLVDMKTIRLQGKGRLVSTLEGFEPVSQSVGDSWRFTAPTIGYVAEGILYDKWQYRLECSGLTTGPQGFLFADYEVKLKYRPSLKTSDLSITAGYRGLTYRSYKETNRSVLRKVDIQGYFWGLEKAF